jgi:hypothetical protein
MIINQKQVRKNRESQINQIFSEVVKSHSPYLYHGKIRRIVSIIFSRVFGLDWSIALRKCFSPL